ncbi:DNA recombination protein RmuC [Patescibacteria group bacterium]
MDTFLIVAVIVLALAFVVMLVFLLRKRGQAGGEDNKQGLGLMADNINRLTEQMSSRLDGVEKRMDDRLKENVRMIEQTHHGLRESTQAFTERMSKIEELSRQMQEEGREQARSMSDLTSILKTPKLRGGLGELLLGDLLEQVFTTNKQYELQYKFKTGDIVDAVVKLRDDTLVPIDAKFSLENFRKFKSADTDDERKKASAAFGADIKNRIDEIATKYILPDEGTLPFAMMYVPAEGIYYHAFINDITKKELYQYALAKNVIPVSPNSLYAYLHVIVMGLRGMEIEQSAKEIMNNITQLEKEYGKVSEDFRLVGVHLNRASSSYNQSEKRLSRFGDKLEQVRAGDKMSGELAAEKEVQIPLLDSKDE